MATEFSMLSIMNAALLAQGQEEILAAGNGTVEWRLLFRNWPLIVESELEDSNYHFTKQQTNLLSRVDGKFGMPDGYLVPLDALHVRRCWITDTSGNRVQVDWLQDGSYVYLDNDSGCFIEYLTVPTEDLWSATFSRAVQLRLEALIAKAIREESREAADLEQQADMMFQRARTSSSKARSAQKPFKAGRISRARRG